MSNKGYKKVTTDKEDVGNNSTHPATSANLLSLFTFWWMNGTLRTGSKRPLSQSDFLPLNEEDRTYGQTEELQQQWNNHIQECENTADKQPKLWKCILRMLSCKEIIFQLNFWFLESILRVSLPLVLGLLLRLLNSAEMDRPNIYLCCLFIGMTGIFSAITHYAAFRGDLLGMRLSSAIKGLVYRKIMVIGQQTLLETTSGQVIDLISNDVQRMEMAPKLMCASFFFAFDFIAVFALVLYLIGWQALMGVLSLMALLPCVMSISSVCARLRQEIAKVSDRRISLINELVTGIRALKAHAWEENYKEKVKEVRRNEVWIILKKFALLSLIEGINFTSGSTATYLSVLTLIRTGQFVSSSTAFMLLALLYVIYVTVCRLEYSAPLVLELVASLERIERFLLLENIPLEPLEDNSTPCSRENTYAQLAVRESLPKDHLAIQSATPGKRGVLSEKKSLHLSVLSLTCTTNEPREKFVLQDVSFDARENSLTVITGQVGSGKSTLLAAIAGEVVKTSGNINCSGTVAYMPQTAWVFSGTLRENVLFGESYEEKKYAEILESCALIEDLNRFPNGDLTFVGEQGIVLSGGQRARVSLARVVYADTDIYLLDDPLSAVDVKVGEHIFEQCICKFLRDKIRILVTYAENYMEVADQVIVLHKGSVVGKGSFHELQDAGKILDAIKDAATTPREEKMSRETRTENDIPLACFKDASADFGENLEISEEDRTTGKISFALYWNYIRAGIHPLAAVLLILLFLVTQAIMLTPDVWLAFLTKMSWEDQQDASTTQVYASLVAAAFVSGIIRACLFFHVLFRSAKELHDRMVTCLLQAPVLFFDTNPTGRILNRCSKDIGCVDELLPKMFLFTIHISLRTITAVLMPSFLNSWLFLVTLPALVAFFFLTWYYLKTSRELKRLESISRSPVFSHFSETMAGLSTIRNREKEMDFEEQFCCHQDLHNQAFYMVSASTYWLAMRADVLCSVLITAVAFAFVLLSRDPGDGWRIIGNHGNNSYVNLPTAFTGLALVYAMETAKMLQFMVRQFAEIENAMTSVERVMAYASLDSEPGYKIKTLPPMNWPHAGHVSFRDVSLKYYPGGPNVLKNLTFNIQERIKLGIVGRTGDGKSSIVAALLRMPEAEGEIFIDGVSIKNIQLQESRKCISVLSQSPVLLSGTLRKNLDPLEKHRDDELWNALEEVELTSLVKSLDGQLDYELLEGGENLSVGERQMICLARTLLQQSKIVILDEPTAHVDPNTEATIWNTVRQKLKNSTVITIAHRLNTVKDCDVILVLKAGQVAELDTLDILLGREGGVFYSMAASQDLLS